MKQIRKILWIMSVVTLLLAMPTTVSAVTKEKFVGTTYRINVKGNFKWTSSNKKIAVVDTLPLPAGFFFCLFSKIHIKNESKIFEGRSKI